MAHVLSLEEESSDFQRMRALILRKLKFPIQLSANIKLHITLSVCAPSPSTLTTHKLQLVMKKTDLNTNTFMRDKTPFRPHYVPNMRCSKTKWEERGPHLRNKKKIIPVSTIVLDCYHEKSVTCEELLPCKGLPPRYVAFKRRNTKATGHQYVKVGVCVLANSSITAERNKTPFTGIQVQLKLSSNRQTDQKSVHSTKRYSDIKAPYQRTNGSCPGPVSSL